MVPPTVSTVSAGEPSLSAARRGRKSTQQPLLVVGGLAAAIIVLGAIACGVLGRTPKTQDEEVATATTDPSTTDASAIGDAEADPGGEADPTVEEPIGKQAAVARKPTLPRIARWVDASSKKGILRAASTMVRFHVVNVWLDSSEPASPTLTVEVNVTNSSSSESLDFQGWTAAWGGSGKNAVVLVDDKGDPLALASTATRAGGGRLTARRLRPGESATELLVFEKPGSDYEHLRLVLPYAAIGRTGHIGFEIPGVMVKDRPPEAEEPDAIVLQPAEGRKLDMTDAPSQSGEPESIEALRESIGGGISDDGQSTLDANFGMPPSDTPGKPDGPTGGLRRAVEGADQMEEGLQKE